VSPIVLSVLALAASGLDVARPARLLPGATEVVVAADAPKTVRFAADEMTNLLSLAFGQSVPVVTNPTDGRAGVYLGSNVWTRAAGIDTAALKRDAFSIVVRDGNVYIAGRDSPQANIYNSVNANWAGTWDLLHERATVFGVYEFLERHAGVRLYFPGELGTIVSRASALTVPEGTLAVEPDFAARNYSWFDDGVYFAGDDRERKVSTPRKLQYVRNRMQTFLIPCCHGTGGFRIQHRFAKEHPEYMLLFSRDGKKLERDVDPKETRHHPGQLCHSSAVYDELFEDICSYARGEDPSVRGMGSWKNDGSKEQDWAITTFRRPYVDIMPQDGMQACKCANCQATYNTNECHYATELVWGRTVELANRLKKAGVNDIRLTQMAYTPYRRIPDFDIPDNVDVMVAEGGPWNLPQTNEIARQYGEIRGWAEKLGRPVWIWTYPCKSGRMCLPNIPSLTPRAWGLYYQRAAKWIFGAYANSDCDRAFYNYLSYYVFGKVCWNTKVDVDALLAEYYQLMFGPAAKDMAAFSDDVERIWLSEVSGKTIETPVGPQNVAPSPHDLYVRIYSEKTLARWDAWLKEAEAKVDVGSLESRRIALYRQEIYEPLDKASRAYRAEISVESELARRAAHPERRNLLVNADFTQTCPCASKRHFGIFQSGPGPSWRGGWIGGENGVTRVSFHDDAPKGVGGRVVRIVGDPAGVVVLNNYFAQINGRLKPGGKYRISFFVRLTDVVPVKRQSGAGVRAWSDHNHFFPHNYLTGTTDWIAQSFEFTAGPKSAACESGLEIFLRFSTGRVEYAGLRLEELR